MSVDLLLFGTLNGWYSVAPPTWAFIGGTLAAVALAVYAVGSAILAKQTRWLLAGAISVAVCDPLCARLLKPAFSRDRPCAVLDAVAGPRTGPGGPVACGSGGSMPSNHAANTAALAFAMASPQLTVVSLVVGVSRVVTGQHWPSDVVVGWGLGAGIGWAVRLGLARALNWR